MNKSNYMGIPRGKIEWYPIIDHDLCNRCYACLDFCPYDVLDKNEKGDIVVKNKENCTVFCQACRHMCEIGAISFPNKKEVLSFIKSEKGEYDERGQNARI